MGGDMKKSAKTAEGQPRLATSRQALSATVGGPRLAACPPGLSTRNRTLWADLHVANDFAPHEDDQLGRALRWFDVADCLQREAGKLKGPERIARLKSAGDAATTGLRHWRTLKFVDPAKPARRPGRPPGKPSCSPEEAAAVLRFGHA
jgi:hypothetical protein